MDKNHIVVMWCENHPKQLMQVVAGGTREIKRGLYNRITGETVNFVRLKCPEYDCDYTVEYDAERNHLRSHNTPKKEEQKLKRCWVIQSVGEKDFYLCKAYAETLTPLFTFDLKYAWKFDDPTEAMAMWNQNEYFQQNCEVKETRFPIEEK